MARRRASRLLRFAHVGHAGEPAGVPDGVLHQEIFNLLFEGLRKKIVGGPHVRELGVGAAGRDRMAREERIDAARLVVGGVGVP